MWLKRYRHSKLWSNLIFKSNRKKKNASLRICFRKGKMYPRLKELSRNVSSLPTIRRLQRKTYSMRGASGGVDWLTDRWDPPIGFVPHFTRVYMEIREELRRWLSVLVCIVLDALHTGELREMDRISRSRRGVTGKLRAEQGVGQGGRQRREEEGLHRWWLSR